MYYFVTCAASALVLALLTYLQEAFGDAKIDDITKVYSFNQYISTFSKKKVHKAKNKTDNM